MYESDCANLVQGKGVDRSLVSAMIMDIKHELASRASWSVAKIWREQNKIAYNLAKFALKLRSSQESYVVVPPCIQDLVLCDGSGVGSPGILLNKGGFFVTKKKKLTPMITTNFLDTGR
jgi:hypothetical protein